MCVIIGADLNCEEIKMIFETHAHYDDEAFDEDRYELIPQLFEGGVNKIVNVGASMESTRTSLELARKYDYIYAAVGVHPNEVAELTEDSMEEIKKYTKDEKVVAIGEIGLEYHYLEPDKETQMKWYRRQMDLAVETKMPVIIHSRDAAEETFNVMKEYAGRIPGAIIHCYSYSPQLAKEYVKLGYYIGVGGVVTFKNAKKLVKTVEEISLENIVLETDCPYMAPEPHRGTRNNSLNINYVAAKIAEIKGVTKEEVEDITYKNAMNFYRIPREA